MTPRLALTALLVAAASSARAMPQDPAAGAPASTDCKFRYVSEDWKFPGPSLPKAECDFMSALDQDFGRLVAVSGLPKDNVSLSPWVILQPYFNAYAHDGTAVVVNDKFIKKLLANRPAAVWVLAHEVGHLVQNVNGEGSRRAQVWRACGYDVTSKAWNDFNRVFESQADRIAGELLSLAHYPPSDAAAVEAALGDDGFQLSSNHTHPANGIRWLEALKHQEELNYARYVENKKLIRHRARLLMVRPGWDRDPETRTDLDKRAPIDWADEDPAAARYRSRPKYVPGAKLEQFDSQGRLPTARTFPVFSKTEPAVPTGPSELSVSDRLALRARTLGPQTSYVSAVWAGAYDWFLDGGFWRKKVEPATPAKP